MRNKNIRYSPKINYRGELKISLVDAGGNAISIKEHNAGTENLFKYLALCILGEDVRSSCPRALMVTDSDNVPLLSSGPVGVRDRKPIKENDDWCAVLRFTINRDQISNPGSGKAVKFKLLGGEGTTPTTEYAVVEEIDPSTITQLVYGTTLYIEWTLVVKNEQSTSAGE